MKQPLNEQFRRMQKLAGIITENQINKESNSFYQGMMSANQDGIEK